MCTGGRGSGGERENEPLLPDNMKVKRSNGGHHSVHIPIHSQSSDPVLPCCLVTEDLSQGGSRFANWRISLAALDLHRPNHLEPLFLPSPLMNKLFLTVAVDKAVVGSGIRIFVKRFIMFGC
ncbi:hypothetical protein NE237_001286 [Protea cynaroides]|uniref:Uncharacterized protein n=1 Tax=Protea cynaroides TaxID=273540 RepID=A0A9Q0QXX8_9MAGN|nr:hypothetical protein NE237_001286 [Protea cynaroides]